METIDDTDFGRQRISLMILSVAIIMYVVGGGKIGTDGAIFGGTIHFENPDIIIWTGLSLYVWFNWMLLLSSKPHIRKFILNFKYLIYTSIEYRQLAADFIGELEPNVYGGFKAQNHLDDSIMYSHATSHERQPYLPPLLTNILVPDTLFFNKRNHKIVDWDRKEIEPWKRIKEYPVPHIIIASVIKKPVPLLKMYWLELKCLYKAMLFYKPFAFVIAPFLLSSIAAGVLLWDFGTFGVMSIIYWLLTFGKEYFKIILIILSLIFVLRIAR